MASQSSVFLDAMLVMLIAILAYVALRKVFFPYKKPTYYQEARGLLEKRLDLKENLDSLKGQFVSGELDSKHYRSSLNHMMQELSLVERKLKQIGFG